jgi:plastocyanin
MPKSRPGNSVTSFILLHLAFTPLMIAQEAATTEKGASPSYAEIHGRISLSKRDDTHPANMRDQMFGMYSIHGGNGASSLIGSSPGTAGRLSERAVVYLESDDLNQGPYAPGTKSPSLDQKNLQFHPQVLPVMVGTRVEFPNRDNLFHNVFSYSQAKEFDLGRYPKDDSRSVTFDRPGVVRVYCDIHSHMSATILVLKHPYFTSPDDSGVYVLSRVPPGRYKVVLWYDRDPVERKSVEVKAGEDLQLDFTNQGRE